MGRDTRSRARGQRNRRRVHVRRSKKTLLVFCEGDTTEPEYLDALKREPSIREAASVQWQRNTIGVTPSVTLVRKAVEALESTESAEIDEVWCLFDVESPRPHPNLREAMDLAKRSGVKVAVSNPCFELWLALHFQDYSRWLEASAAEKLRSRHDGAAGKEVDGAVYMPRREDAAARARLLDEQHRKNGKAFPHDNPSSGMYLFLDTLATTD